jgi:hypothetical protein
MAIISCLKSRSYKETTVFTITVGINIDLLSVRYVWVAVAVPPMCM